MKRKLLIATTNPGKYQEIVSELADAHFTFVSLKDVKLDSKEHDEPFDTLEQNAIHKARWYATKSKLLTLADDSGLFIDYLKGKPGVNSKNSAKTETERNKLVLTQLKGVPTAKRRASFKTAVCLYDPATRDYHTFTAQTRGYITQKEVKTARDGMGFDPIFYYPPLKKTYAELSISQKNSISHRGKVLNRLKFYLQRAYGFKQIIVPCGLVVKDRKLLLLQRRDSRPEFNNKWEFPGGGVEANESPTQALLREVKEETGYTVHIQTMIPTIYQKTETKYNYQVFLMLYICTITGGTFKTADNETADHAWCSYAEVLKKNLLPLNTKIVQQNKQLLQKFID